MAMLISGRHRRSRGSKQWRRQAHRCRYQV